MSDVVTAMFVVVHYPRNSEERRLLAIRTLPRLMARWSELALPFRSTMYVLVSSPAELGPSTAAAAHRADQVAGLVADTRGGEGVAVFLTDRANGVEEHVALIVEGLDAEAELTTVG